MLRTCLFAVLAACLCLAAAPATTLAQEYPEECRAAADAAKQATPDLDKAIGLYQACLREDLGTAGRATVLSNLGVLQMMGGLEGQALESFQKAHDINPGDIYALNNLAWLYAAADDRSLRDGEKALKYAKRASLLRPGPGTMDTLAAAQAQVGNFEAAVRIAEETLAMAKNSHKADHYQQEIQRRIELYSSKKSYEKP